MSEEFRSNNKSKKDDEKLKEIESLCMSRLKPFPKSKIIIITNRI